MKFQILLLLVSVNALFTKSRRHDRRTDQLMRSKRDEIGWNRLSNNVHKNKRAYQATNTVGYSDQMISHLISTGRYNQLQTFLKIRSRNARNHKRRSYNIFA